MAHGTGPSSAILPRMTIPDFADAPLLLTDADMLTRVHALVGPACTDRQLWIMFVDGGGRQTPVVMPVSEMPRHPPTGLLDGVASVLRGLRDDLTQIWAPAP